MASLSQAKILGEVGSILVVLAAIPTVGGLLGIVGFILLLIAVKDISDYVGDKSIFNNMLISVGAAIVGLIVGVFVVLGSVINVLVNNGMMGYNPSVSNIPQSQWMSLIGPALAAFAILWVALIVSAVFVRRSYSSIAEKLNIGMFRTAGLIYIIGAATAIILIGFVLILVAQILLIIAFFSIPENPPPAQTSPPPPPSSTTASTI